MSLLNKLEKKLYKYTIPNLYFGIIICTIIGYVIRYVFPSLYNQLLLIPYMVVVRGQVWRLFTWIFTVPYEGGLLTILLLPINLYFYYYLGKNLEMYWGRFLYNLYVLGGAILTDILVVIGGFYFYYWSADSETNKAVFPYDVQLLADPVSAALSITRYMYISIFLAFTVFGGDRLVYLYFFIPIKMKWLGYIDLVLMGYYFITGGLFTKIIVFCSLANYFTYFLINLKRDIPSVGQLQHRYKFHKAVQKQKHSRREAEHELKRRRAKTGATYNSDGTIRFPGGSNIIPPGYGNPDSISIHKCAVCGRTEKTNPELEFRFCSRCNGNYEYCSEHLYTHKHVE